MVVLLAFAESKTASIITLGLDFSTVWDQTPPIFWVIIASNDQRFIDYCPQHYALTQWNVIGFSAIVCASTVTCFSLWGLFLRATCDF